MLRLRVLRLRAGWVVALAGLVAFGCLAVVPAGRSWAEYQAKGKRDPFAPLLTAEGLRTHPPGFDEKVATGIDGVVLQGIMFDPKGISYAILNGKVVREQEEFEGMKVIKIEPKAATVLSDGQPHRLTLLQRKDQEESPTQ